MSSNKYKEILLSSASRKVILGVKLSWQKNAFPLNSTDFRMVFTFLVRFLDHDFQNLEARTFPEEAPKVLRTIGYPAHISKQTFQSLGTMHSWPAALAILDFLLKRAKLAKLSIANSRETINSIAFIIFFTGITILWILVIADVRIWAPYCLVPICITSSILLFCGSKKENKDLAIHLFLTIPLILFCILFAIFNFDAIGIEIANGIKPMKIDDVEHNEVEESQMLWKWSLAQQCGY